MVYWLVKYLCEEKDWKTFTQMFFFFLKLFVLLFSSTTFLLKTFCYSFCRKKINGTCKKLCLSFLILITSSKGLHSLNYQGWNKVQATFLSHKSTFETVSSRVKIWDISDKIKTRLKYTIKQIWRKIFKHKYFQEV